MTIHTELCDRRIRIITITLLSAQSKNPKAGGGFKKLDYWNIYSFDLIEKLVKSCASDAEVIWFLTTLIQKIDKKRSLFE